MSWIGERLVRRWREGGEPVRYTPPPPAPPPPPPEPSILTRLMFWRAVVAAEAQRAPSVDRVQRTDAEDQRRRVTASADAIARGIAKGGGAWFPHDDR